MKNRFAGIKGFTLNVRLTLAILPVLLAVIVLFGQQCKKIYTDMIVKELTTQLELQLDSTAAQITGTLKEINRMGLYVYSNQELREKLAEALLTPEKFTSSDRISLQNDLIAPMMRTIDSPGSYRYRLYPLSSRVFCDYDNVYPLSSFPSELPLDEMMDNGYAVVFYNALDIGKGDTGKHCLFITRVMYHSDRTPLAVLATIIYTDNLESTIKPILPDEGNYYYRCTLENGETLFEAGTHCDDMIDISTNAMNGRLHLQYSVLPGVINEQLARQSNELRHFAIIMACAAIVLISALSWLVMHRMKRVITKFENIKPGQDVSAPMQGHDEAAMLDATFTHIYRDYCESVASRQKLKESQRLLENNLLLSRINPHFLYNTLSAIRWNMPVESWPTIDNLVAFYRGMLSKGREIAQLVSEVELMEQYLELQRFTYSRDIHFEKKLEDGTQTLFLPKFILQPIFENAIKYGGTKQCLNLCMSACKADDKLIILLWNDGTAMANETMRSLNALNLLKDEPLFNINFERDDAYGYGIFNVIMRIRLLFGAGYGLEFECPKQGGTLARFTLPICDRPETIFKANTNGT